MERSEYDRLARLFIDDVYRAALSVCRSREEAEDAVQSAFLKLLTADTKFNGDEHARRWLIRVAVNSSLNSMKSFWRRNVSFFDELEGEPEAMSSDERWLLDEVGRLPPKYSSALHLYYYEGYSCAEIAQMLDISESSVQTRLMRARKMLKKNLEEA